MISIFFDSNWTHLTYQPPNSVFYKNAKVKKKMENFQKEVKKVRLTTCHPIRHEQIWKKKVDEHLNKVIPV